MNTPVRDIELIKVLANAIVVWFVVMEIVPLTSVQQAATLTMIMSVINVAGAWWQSRETTALANPRDTDGVPLSRPGDVPANKQMAEIQGEAIEMNEGVQP